MTSGEGVDRTTHPLFQTGEGGSIPTSPHLLRFYPCDPIEAVRLVRAWHSRLPNCQRGPWMYAFIAEYQGRAFAAALWNSPSARCLPQHWIELRRMVVSDDAPKNTASRFLGWMVRWMRAEHPEHERAISYQDTEVHKGTMYKACGWSPAFVSKPRVRDRGKNRVGTERKYRSNINGCAADAASKVRWEVPITRDRS